MRRKDDKATNDNYIAFITFNNEDSGRELLATYLKGPKKNLKRFFKAEPFFNIFESVYP